MDIDDVIAVLKEHYGNIPCKKDGFISLPKSHCFAVWRIVHRKAVGADGWNAYWNITYELRIYYRDSKSETDMGNEYAFEQDLRECESLESDYGYDDNDKLDITIYRFNGVVDF